MTILARAAVFAAAFTLVAASHLEAQSSKVRVTIAGGPHAGTYEKTDFCELKDTFPSMFIMAYTVGAMEPKNPRSIEFFTASGKGKPDGFLLKVDFMQPGNSTAYEIFAIPRDLYPPGREQAVKGRGTVTIRQAGTGKTATFRGQTADGVRIEGSVDCQNHSSAGS
jgi:hypothetical protein